MAERLRVGQVVPLNRLGRRQYQIHADTPAFVSTKKVGGPKKATVKQVNEIRGKLTKEFSIDKYSPWKCK